MELLDRLMAFLDTEANSTITDSKFWSSKTKEVPQAWRWWHRASSEEVRLWSCLIGEQEEEENMREVTKNFHCNPVRLR